MVDAGAIGAGELTPYQKALTSLQADAPPMDSTLALRTLENELGRPVDAVFAEFDAEPVAAAPSVRYTAPSCMTVVGWPSRSSTRAWRRPSAMTCPIPSCSPPSSGSLPARRERWVLRCPISGEAAAEISARISEELDYRQEAAHIRAFGELYRGHPFIRVPR